MVVPAVEASAFRHTLGDIDEPRREAEARLWRVLKELRANGIEAAGEVGDPEIGSAYLPGLSRADFAGMVAGIFGTIVAAILAGAVAVDNGEVTGRAAAAILIAIGIALVNMAHVVGLTLMESIRYRGGFAKLFR
jgi:hypothetical protein